MEDIILIGGGGHCKSCIDVIEQEGKYHIAGIIDLPEKAGDKILDYKISGSDEDLEMLSKKYRNFLVTLGFVKSPELRIRLYKRLKELGVNLPVIISPRAYVSKHALISEGTIVMHGSIVNASAHIGANCIINSRALVEHDAFVCDHCHIATAAVVNGGVVVGAGSFIGSGAITVQYTLVPEYSFIKAGSLFKS